VLTQISLYIPDSVNSKVKDTCRKQRIGAGIKGGREIFE
jgi:hypothetical protein